MRTGNKGYSSQGSTKIEVKKDNMDRFTQLVLLMLLGPLSVACYVVQNDLYRSDK